MTARRARVRLQMPSFAFSMSFTACGLALPPDDFITWPTNQPASCGFAFACATLSGLAAMISSTAFSIAPRSVTCFMPRASTSSRGSPPSLHTMSNRSLPILPEIADEARLLLVRQFRQIGLQRVDEVLRELERQQVGVGEIAIVVRLFLGAHRAGLALIGIEQPGLLLDRAAILQDADLAPRLVVDRLADEADRVDVLDLAAGAERSAGLSHRDVEVGAQRAFLHVAVAGAEVTQDRAQLRHIGARLLRRAHVRLRDDLHQRHAGTVEIDQRHARMLVVQRLAGILLEVQPFDADLDAVAIIEVDRELGLAHDWLLVLADLIALRQVGEEIVLAVEHRAQIYLRVQAEPGADRLPDAFLIDDRQHAGHRRVHQRDVAVGLAAEFGRGAGKQFRVRGDLGVDLKPDHHLPIAARAPDQFRACRAHDRSPCRNAEAMFSHSASTDPLATGFPARRYQ